MNLKYTLALTLMVAAVTMAISSAPLRASETDNQPIDVHGGPSLLRFNFTKAMTGTGETAVVFGESDASGRVAGMLSQVGKVSNQRFDLAVAGLNRNTAYELFAYLGEDTNATSVIVFTTDRLGAFRLGYFKNSQGRGARRAACLQSALG